MIQETTRQGCRGYDSFHVNDRTLCGEREETLFSLRIAGIVATMGDMRAASKKQALDASVEAYNNQQDDNDSEICTMLATEICRGLPEAENKIWHRHPVWFIEGNPIVGYSKQKAGIRLMFWSGASFDEDGLAVRGEKFRDASVFYNSADEIRVTSLRRWLKKSREIQWDYKNIVKRKGRLERLK